MKVLVVDNSDVFRLGIRQILGQQLGAESVADCESVAAIGGINGLTEVDLVLLEDPGRMTPIAGLIAAIAEQAPNAVVVAMGSGQDMSPERAQLAVQSGAAGYLSKSAPGSELAAAIRHVLDGHIYVPPQLLRDMVRGGRNGSGGRRPLTPRQVDVLRLVAEGLPNKLIAHRMALSEATIKAHLNAAMRSLGSHNRLDAVNRANSMGLI